MLRPATISILSLTFLTGCTARVDSPAKAPAQGGATSQPTSQPAAPKTTPAAAPAAEFRNVGAAEAKKLLDAGGVKVLDIRTPEEFAAGHIQGALNIDFKSRDFATRLEVLDKSATYLVHCKSGGRSGRALPTLKELGFQKVIHLETGADGWAEAGLPLQK